MHRLKVTLLAGPSLALAIIAAPAFAQNAPSAQAAGQGTSIDVAKLFATSCGFCHQAGGRVAGRGPKLAGTDKPDEVIVGQIKKGKPPGMPAFGRAFNDDQIKAIVAYIRALQP